MKPSFFFQPKTCGTDAALVMSFSQHDMKVMRVASSFSTISYFWIQDQSSK